MVLVRNVSYWRSYSIAFDLPDAIPLRCPAYRNAHACRDRRVLVTAREAPVLQFEGACNYVGDSSEPIQEARFAQDAQRAVRQIISGSPSVSLIYMKR